VTRNACQKQGHYKEAIKVCDYALVAYVGYRQTAEVFQPEFSARKLRLHEILANRAAEAIKLKE